MLLRPALLLCLLLAGSPALAHGTHEARLAEAERAIATDPGNPDLYRSRSVLHLEHGDSEAALADLDRAEALDPSRPLTDLLRGRLELARGRPDAAHEALQRCVSAWPEHPDAQLELARAHAARGDAQAAAERYELALALAPVASPTLYLERARALYAAGRTDEALAGLDAGIQRLGPHPALVDAAIGIELERDAFDAALARLAGSPSGQRPDLLLRRGEILERAGRTAEARRAYRAALAELSERRRDSPALRELAARARAALERLES